MSKGIYIHSPKFADYDFGPQHPMQQRRLLNTFDLLTAYNAFSDAGVLEPISCTYDDLAAIHSEEFLDAVIKVSGEPHANINAARFGLSQGDTPAFPGMWEASLRYCGASLQAAALVASGTTRIAMNLSGGLHHAQRNRASGFCVFNDCAVAINRLRERFDRVAYVDIDVHHGDGVQALFYDDPTVLTVSIHQSGRTLYPGTGHVHELGVREGEGYSVNIPLWPYTPDEIWLNAWREGVLPILQAFKPGAIVLQLGTDAHILDPLAQICLTAEGWLEAVKDVNQMGLPIVGLGGGGYNPTTVPRMWALAFEELFGVPLPDETPSTFRLHDKIPALRDQADLEIPSEALEEAKEYADEQLALVKQVLFPLHGL
jgi:acetoin utilization protein AcuC